MKLAVAWSIALLGLFTLATRAQEAAPRPVSYYQQVRPIFQAACQGCHQPAKAGGGFVMTAHDRLLKGGESEMAAVVPGQPDTSNLIDQITAENGKAAMPPEKPPLPAADVALIRRWIAEGAVDDTPANAVQHYDGEHPPVYSRQPVVTAIDYSPDGSTLAIGGFHEVLLWKADGSERIGRLIGLSERIESLRFSPDGKKLAVSGGLPARMGEVQVWDVARGKLLLSAPVTTDTVYGVSWSPDGTKLAFGCTDNTVRAIDAKTGEQVLFMGSHNDWVLDTTFSNDGNYLISVGRDMTAKLTEVANQRFMDNVTSITPGALKGGLAAVGRVPTRDEVLVGGSDGAPKLYRIHRETPRVIGDDANAIGSFEAIPGRIFGIALSADGKRFAAVGGLDSSGRLDVYDYGFDVAGAAEAIQKIHAKAGPSRSVQERAELDKARRESVRRRASVAIASPVYAVAMSPDGKRVVAAGGDGVARIYDADDGRPVREFAPAPVSGATPERPSAVAAAIGQPGDPGSVEALPEGVKIVSIEVQPSSIALNGPFAAAQLVVIGKAAGGEAFDLTRLATYEPSGGLIAVSRRGRALPKRDGVGPLMVSAAGLSVVVPVKVVEQTGDYHVNYVQDVSPLLSRLGCNAGTCHGSAQGKNGFKLSLRGYDPIFDVRALTDDHGARRVNLASVDDSLMLLKPSGGVPHVGGAVARLGEPYYEELRGWIADGCKLDLTVPRVNKLEVYPTQATLETVGSRQQLRVVATFGDGATRDVTREAFLETGNAEVATVDRDGLLTSIRRGEAPILVRYEGNYAASTITVMGDRTGFAWSDPPQYNAIDRLTADKWQRLKVQPSDVCGDAEFVRRVSIDLTGLPPTSADLKAFLADPRDSREKREALVDRLVGNPDYVDYWTNKWADLLQVNRKFLGVEGAVAFRGWIREQVDGNAPYDQFVRAILTATGSNRQHPAASYFKVLREPDATMENTTQLFLGIRFNCNKCHDHPFERWTQDQYYETAAFFAQFGLSADPESKGRQIGGTAVEGAKPLFEAVQDRSEGEVVHDRTKQVAPPRFPFDCQNDGTEAMPRRQRLAAWLTSKDNPYFARSYVNRLWGYLLGVGIIEPIDDVRAGNPASNPELLDYLTSEFLKSNYDVRHVIKLIAKSRTYQLSVAVNKWNEDDKVNYSHATARRLPAEVLLDGVYRVTGSVLRIPGVPDGTRAAALPDSAVDLPSGFLNTFGRPARESACECERSSGLQLGPVMALISGPTVADAIADPSNELGRLAGRLTDDKALVEELFLRILNRPATGPEIDACLENLQSIDADHQAMAARLGQLEGQFALKRPQLERDRAAAIQAAQAAISAHEAEAAPRIAEAEKQRAEKIAAQEAALKAYETQLSAKVADWEKHQSPINRWQSLTPTKVSDTNKATFTVQADGVVLASGSDAGGELTFVAETDLTDLVGLRLELLTDDSLPARGPGRAPDGNLVLNQIKLTAASKADPKQTRAINLLNPLADFNQQGFEVKNAVDGSPNGGKGWAVSPALGVPHWATFELAENAGFAGGTILTVTLTHRFQDKQYMPGRFRLSVTRGAKPIGLGLLEDLRATVATGAEVRSLGQQQLLLSYQRAIDPEYHRLVGALNASRAPLPIDPRLKDLRDQLESATRPVLVDPALLQLRQDVEQSVQQAAARRLTAAQDVAWALVNSPAFLYNH